MSIESRVWMLRAPGAPLAQETLVLPEPSGSEVILEVEACGLCHTDLGFASGEVTPRHDLPLVLGHEIVGTVVRAGERAAALAGKKMLVPAVIPCGDCAYCRAGRGNACPGQRMPGNDLHGGFATHLLGPGHALVPLDGAPAHLHTDALCVVADAVSTAYQAVHRAGVERGDAVFIVGAGGVGGFVAQVAHAAGARVAVCDMDEARLSALTAHGIDHAVDVRGREAREVRKELHRLAATWKAPSLRWRIFECSGTPTGQQLAYGLLGHAATLVIVGYTRDSVVLRLSNLMAFDATVHGTWGCPVEAYPAALRLVYEGRVQIEPFIERAPMSRLNQHLAALAEHRLPRRLVLDPRA